MSTAGKDGLRRLIDLRSGGEAYYASNRVRSYLYAWRTCVPVCLIQQFQCASNVWFLVIAVLQLSQIERDTEGKWMTFAPLAFLLLFRLLKDLYWDYWRHQNDSKSNSRLYQVWDGQQYRDVECSNIVVGNYVLLKEGSRAPADLLLLSSGRPDKTCYIDCTISTSEPAPQLKKPVKETSQVLRSIILERVSHQINKLSGIIKLGEPQPSLSTFEATIKVPRSPKAVPISVESFIPRSAIIKAAPWVIALVVYTGAETKLMLSARRKARKQNNVERRVNRWLGFYMGVVVFFAGLFALISLSERENDGFWVTFLVLFLQFGNLVPISLLVSMDIIRLFQAFFIRKDPDLSVTFQSSDITDSLGQVEYLFLDPLVICPDSPVLTLLVVNENEYYRASSTDVSTSKDLYRSEDNMPSTTDLHPLTSAEGRSMTLDSIKGFERLKRVGFMGNDRELDLVCECLTLCLNKEESGLMKEDQAIIETLAELGCVIEQATETMTELNLFGRHASYDLIAYWSNTVATKRYRAVVWKRSENCGYLFIRGAFSVMGNVLDISSNQYKRLETTVNSFGTRGITPSIIGYARLTEEKVVSFRNKVEMVRLAVTGIEEKLNKQFEMLEAEAQMEYAGIVGFAQMVDEEVKEALQDLAEAGVRTWLVSCDSETRSLAATYATGLTQPDHSMIHLKAFTSAHALLQELTHCVQAYVKGTGRYLGRINYSISEFTHVGSKRVRTQRSRTSSQFELIDDASYLPHNLNYGVSIDHISFQQALSNSECTKLLTYLLFCANSVSFYSLPPSEKQLVVEFVRTKFSFHPVTLAIGSDASTMGMLQTADIGVALRNRSHLAANNSDIIAANMTDVHFLLLKHGLKNYLRISKVVVLFVYNSVLLTVVLMWYATVSQYSAAPVITPGLVACYTVIFTAIPVIAVGVLDESVDWKTMKKLPVLYQEGTFSIYLNFSHLFKITLSATFQSLLLIGLLFPTLLSISPSGHPANLPTSSSLYLLVLVTTATAQALVMSGTHSLPSILACILGIGLTFLYLGVCSSLPDSDLFSTLWGIFHTPADVISLIFTPIATFLVAYSFSTYKKLFRPSLTDLCRTGKFSMDVGHYLHIFPRLIQFKHHLKRVYSGMQFSTQTVLKNPFHLNRLSLKFVSEHIEDQFSSIFIKEKVWLFRGVLCVLLAVIVTWTGVGGYYTHEIAYDVCRAVLCLLFAGVLLLMCTSYILTYYRAMLLITIWLLVIGKFLAELEYTRIDGVITTLFAMISYNLLNVDFLWVTGVNVVSLVLFVITASVSLSGSDTAEAVLRILCYVILVLVFSLVSGCASYILSFTTKLEYKVRSNTEQEVERSRSILSLLLPPFVITKVKDREKGECIAEHQGDVTVIFCDIYDFDNICVLYKPQELTAFLDDVFQQFDDLCMINGVVKIETVGKTYMACAGLKYVDQDLKPILRDVSHARRAVEFSLDLLRCASNYKIKSGGYLQLKIGINSGPVISGVVGLHKPQFSLVGDTVNTASRMCSTLESVNAIQISENTKMMMVEQSGIYLEPRTVFAKGKGDVQTYLVSGEGGLDQSPVRMKSLSLSKFTEMSSFAHREPSREIDFNEDFHKATMKSPSQPELIEAVYRAGYLTAAEKQSLVMRRWNSGLIVGTPTLLCVLRVVMLFEAERLVCWQVIAARCGLVCMGLFYLQVWKRGRTLVIPWLDIPCVLGTYVLSVMDILYSTEYDTELVALELMLLYLVATWTLICTLRDALILAAGLLVLWLSLLAAVTDWQHQLILLALMTIHVAINTYNLNIRQRQLHQYAYLKLIEEQEIGKNEQLLAQMMPKKVYEKLKEDLPVTDLLRNMSILFADIVGFTNWSSDKLPEEVVGMLSALFTQFDRLCVDLKLYKVHTIGDCYVVMGFDGSSDSVDPSMGCLRVFCMAYEMIKVIQEVNVRENIQLNMRIGIHTGDVIAGITGRDVVRYDIYGSAVMVANKMESGGAAGRINVSEVTREVLERVAPGLVEYTENKEIEAKSIKKKYLSYFARVLDPRQLMELLEEA